MVAFFSPTCRPCQEKLPRFVEYARSLPDGRNRTLAVVVGEAERAASFVDVLSPVTRVVVEDRDGAVASAFEVKAYPTIVRVAPDEEHRLVVTADQVDLTPSAAASAVREGPA